MLGDAKSSLGDAHFLLGGVCLGVYITDIFSISVKAARTDEEEVALQAIELWSTLCEVELELADEDASRPARLAENKKFVEQALPHLCPMLLETLLKQVRDFAATGFLRRSTRIETN
jgi:hypothetical protein